MPKINHRKKPCPPRSSPTVYVLWGDEFEEATTAIMVTELRSAGIRVKVIGLSGRTATGMHGITFYTDMVLGQALKLANAAICVVIPCGLARIRRITNDPRLINFFNEVTRNEATYVLSHTLESETLGRQTIQQTDAHVEFYPSSDELIGFAQQLAYSLPHTRPRVRA